MIDVQAAERLLDFGVRIGDGPRAREQLEGAVAVHNVLQKRGVAYLADEVGMGKTYVALGAMALFRHFRPSFRVLVIAPRENIQHKWMKELRNFVAHNVRFPDLRVKALDGRPARPLVACGNLLDLVREATLQPDRDFFLRLTSFSLPVTGRGAADPEAARRYRDGLRAHLPWMADEVFDLRVKQAFKDNFAMALCCALPPFDLVIVDEGHNLKHGYGPSSSARNRVLALAMGHPDAGANPRVFRGYGPRARRVLFLSATPVEESYRHLWNQLHVFGKQDPFGALDRSDATEDEKKAVAAKFLIRRVTAARVGGEELTKNLYRREWRRGGVRVHDEPIRVDDPRQRLVVALVQKKVSELLGHERFNASFQIGMLASFESFLETSKLKVGDPDAGNFDDADQTEDLLEKEGIDVHDVNRLAASYRKKFGVEMPHPKMDALVEALSDSWTRGSKALVFVRRVASVKELKRKLDERYDTWLMDRLLSELPESLHGRMRQVFDQYREENLVANATRPAARAELVTDASDQDSGGNDTFFAWFFRGEGPPGVISGANVQQRFVQRGTAYSTFFEDNHVARLLACEPGEVEARLADAIGVDLPALREGVRRRSAKFLGQAKKLARADRFEAVQAAAVEWLKDVPGPLQEAARICWHERFAPSARNKRVADAPDIGRWLELRTFFTELRHRPQLREALWPEPSRGGPAARFREREMRAQLLSSAARLGHGLVDLYTMTVRRLGSLALRAQEVSEDDRADVELARIHEYLDLLEGQMRTPAAERPWGAFDELQDISSNFDLILDVNEPDARTEPLSHTARVFGRLLRQQQPVGGMAGQVNQTLVRQFRMPGYPLVLISTDLLQEGEDLHTFCSAVHHYGISWTPSSMEQRIGRVDRVRSQTDRRLSQVRVGPLGGDAMLQVYFPHLEDTVEVLQVQRVLDRMNTFLRLMHEGLTLGGKEGRTIDADREFARSRRVVPQIRERLRTAFPVREEHLHAERTDLAVGPELTESLVERFRALRGDLGDVVVDWEPELVAGTLLGSAKLGARVQPFTLLLKSSGPSAIVRCISPVGRARPHESQAALVASAAREPMKIGAIVGKEERSYDLTVEGDVLLGPTPDHDGERVAMLVRRVVVQADRLELEHLPGHDTPLGDFREDLENEGNHGR